MFIPLFEGTRPPTVVSWDQIVGGTVYAQRLTMGGGVQSIMQSENFSEILETGWAIIGDGTAFFFGDFTIGGTILVGGDIILTGSGSFQSSASGQRISIDAAGTNGIHFYTDSAQEVHFGYAFATDSGAGAAETLGLHLVSPAISDDGSEPVHSKISLISENEGETVPASVEVGIAAFAGATTPNVTPPQFKMTDDFILMLEDGSETDPSLTFNNAASSGLYKISGSQDFAATVNNGFSARFASPGFKTEDAGRDIYMGAQPVTYGADGTFTKADYPNLKAIIVEMVGGGGAGGGAATSAAGSASGGTGGGAGGYSKSYIAASDLAATEAVTVGQGGAGVSGAAGGNGTDSVFDTISGEVRAKGGTGGTTLASGNTQASLLGADGGISGTGNLIQGAGGHSAGADRSIGGSFMTVSAGGASHWDGGGEYTLEGNGGDGLYGSGGGGARQANAAGSARTGGNGGDGFVIVWLLF